MPPSPFCHDMASPMLNTAVDGKALCHVDPLISLC
jgi:hypothetical protein